MMDEKVFFANGIATVKITDWLDWASGRDDSTSWRIVLPMIQRGSVWKPHQVMDLWDSLLRGMPLGSMLAGMVREQVKYFQPINRKLIELPAEGGLSLLDGQQRTLAMLLAWPEVGREVDMKRRVWIDLGLDDKYDHLFRFHFSTENHPFGFGHSGASGTAVPKLSVAERRTALMTYFDVWKAEQEKPMSTAERRQALWKAQCVVPWHGVVPLNLQKVLRVFRQSANDSHDFDTVIRTCLEEQVNGLVERKNMLVERSKAADSVDLDHAIMRLAVDHLDKQIKAIKAVSESDLTGRVQRLFNSLSDFSGQYMPVIELPDRVFSTGTDDSDKDPALAVLFNRIGTGGTALSNADYVYSVIKHHNPECHTLAETLLANERIAGLFTPVTLVTAAVRLTAARLNLGDYARIDKGQFAGLVRKDGFLADFNDSIASQGCFSRCIEALLQTLSYRGKGDVGLPKQALCLVELPILETLLCWLQTQSDIASALETNRHRLIRFALYSALAVQDPYKASTLMFKELKAEAFADFPEETLMRTLVKEQIALPMRSPELFRTHVVLKTMVCTPASITGLRGWRRFSLSDLTSGSYIEDEERKLLEQAIELYRRFWNRRQSWNYRHELLLWLQRDYVFNAFETLPALPGAEDESPYDYDHICPQGHWSGWTGCGGSNKIIDFIQEPKEKGDQPQSRLGNSIGNVRVWDSSDNRSDSDASPTTKLKLSDSGIATNWPECLPDGVIDDTTETIADWHACSRAPVVPEHEDDRRYWTRERTLAFQRAIENRVFNLYDLFYQQLAPWPD